MNIYYLLAGERATLVLPSTEFSGTGEVVEYFRKTADLNNIKPITIINKYHPVVGEIIEEDPFDFATSSGSLRFQIRGGLSRELNRRRRTIESTIDDLCDRFESKSNRKKVVDDIYGSTRIRGTVHILDFELVDLHNGGIDSKKLLFLQTEYDPKTFTKAESKEPDIPLGLISKMQFGENPRVIGWEVKEYVGEINCAVVDMPKYLKRADQDFLREIMEKDKPPF